MTYTEEEHAQWLASLPRKVMGAAVLFTEHTGPQPRVLLVEPTYKEGWDLPGGVIEAGESPQAGAFRETHEELGVQVAPGRLLLVNYAPPRVPGGDSINWVFEGGALDEAEIVLQDEELRAWTWCTAEDVPRLTNPRMARIVTAALGAHLHGGTVYAENGLPMA
ncbi:NUDIX hydrolase [Kineosporia rhizophila]|uniref:NUDIX domain-containing protein n=1 Tax=Kineosporia TaxID=49184 RepID=UPI001E477AB8|nr:NUDIX hydrolase [Kineosporia sp. NBRC 101677]MCE0535236.1 NUDIX hydrolase [Kineosporia rhizophila]